MGIRTDQDDWADRQANVQQAQAERVVGTVEMGDLTVRRKEQGGVILFDFAVSGMHCALDAAGLARLLRMLAALADLGVGKPDG